MKTRKVLLFGIAVMLASTVYATKIPQMHITAIDPQTAVVEFESFNPTSFEFIVKNNRDEIILYKKSEESVDNFNSKFDFSTLKDGKYEFQFNFGSCSLTRDVVVYNNDMQISEVKKDCKPYFQYDNNYLKVSLFNRNQDNIYLNIYQDGDYLTGVKLGKDLCLQKKVDISKLKKGNYEFVLSDSVNDYQFAINK